MSDTRNTVLFERAAEMIGEWEGTLLSHAIHKAMEDNDLDRLEYLVTQAENEASIQEFHNHEAN